MAMILDLEIAEFERLLPGWLQEGRRGRWVVLKGREVAGFFSTFDEAYREGVKRWGVTNMLIERVLLEEEQPRITVNRAEFR
jgi:hypothetical protein